MKASIIHFEVLGISGFIYCHSIFVDEQRESLLIELKKINETAIISSIGNGLKIPAEQIEKHSLKNWIESNKKYLK